MKTLPLLFSALWPWLVLPGCASSPPPAARIERQAFDRTATITLERTACYGACPVYQIVVRGDGNVLYEGKAHVRVSGRAEKTLGETELSALVAAFNDADYLALENSYENMEVTDHQSVYSSISVAGTERSVRHYLGDRGAPPALTALEDRLDEIVGTSAWIK